MDAQRRGPEAQGDLGDPGARVKGGRRLEALHHRNFTLYWLSQVSANIGSWMQLVATGWLVLELTNSPEA